MKQNSKKIKQKIARESSKIATKKIKQNSKESQAII